MIEEKKKKNFRHTEREKRSEINKGQKTVPGMKT